MIFRLHTLDIHSCAIFIIVLCVKALQEGSYYYNSQLNYGQFIEELDSKIH